MYRGKADWDAIKQGSEIIKSKSPETIVLGNGDCLSRDHGIELCNTYSVDGVLIGRAARGNPWVFDKKIHEINLNEIISTIIKHAETYEKFFPNNIFPLRKHLACYITSIEGASKLRSQLVQINNSLEVKEILMEYLDKIQDRK
jgi:tRNA-dihydrouridine synthase B